MSEKKLQWKYLRGGEERETPYLDDLLSPLYKIMEKITEEVEKECDKMARRN